MCTQVSRSGEAALAREPGDTSSSVCSAHSTSVLRETFEPFPHTGKRKNNNSIFLEKAQRKD